MSGESRIGVTENGIWIWYEDEPVRFIGIRGLRRLIEKIEELQSSASSTIYTVNTTDEKANKVE